MRRTALLILPLAASSHFVTGLDRSLRGMGDCPVTTIASCGARRSAVLSRALGVVEGEPVDVVVQGTIALLDTTCIVDSAIAITASSVVALELRQADLIHDGPHGVSQLTPVLQRWLRLHTGDALLAKKKLLLLVTDADVAEVPATKLTELAAASLARVLAGLDAESVLDAHKLFEVHLIAVPAGATEMTLNEIKDQIFKLSDSEWTLPASAALMAVARAAAAGLGCSDAAFALSMAEANEAYTCMRAADDAARCFTQGLVTLKKSAEVFVADFGAQATSLLDEVHNSALLCVPSFAGTMGRVLFLWSCDPLSSPLPQPPHPQPLPQPLPQPCPLPRPFPHPAKALDAFDGETEGNGLAPAARAGLRNQLLRALTPLFRRQLLVLQRQTLQVFEHSLRAAPPSVTIEAELKALIEEADAAFEKQAAILNLIRSCILTLLSARIQPSPLTYPEPRIFAHIPTLTLTPRLTPRLTSNPHLTLTSNPFTPTLTSNPHFQPSHFQPSLPTLTSNHIMLDAQDKTCGGTP